MYQRRRTGADPSGFRFALAWRAIPLTEFARFAHSDMGSLFFFPGGITFPAAVDGLW